MKSSNVRWRLSWIGILVSSCLFFSLQPCPAFACSCVPPGSPLTERDRAAAVFAGKVIALDAPFGSPVLTRAFPFIDFLVSSADQVRVTFEVSEVWKGPAYRKMFVSTARDGASCGYHFEIGQSYLVYASDQGDGLVIYLCSRTNSVAQATADLAMLGSGIAPTLNSSTPQDLSIYLALGGIGVLLAVLILSLVLWKRRSRTVS